MRKITSPDEEAPLLEMLKQRGGGVKNALDIAYKILGNPIVMIDVAYNLLAYTENKVTDDPLWNELTTLGRFSHETVDFFNAEHFIEDYAKSDVVSLMKSDKLKYDRVNGILFDKNGIQLGNICVVACYKLFAEEDFARIETICEYLSAELQNSKFYQKIGRVFEETCISDLIEGKHVEEALLEDVMERLYANLKSNLYIAVVDVIQYEHTLTHLAYFRELFEELQGEFEYFIYLNNIVVIISTDHIALDIKRDLSGLNEFFIKYKIFAGISSSFQNLLEIQKYYRQALCALNYGLNSGLNHRIFMYDDFRLESYFNSMRDTIDIREICNPAVFLIQEYDQKNGTIYMDILYAYMLNGQDTRRAARTMELEEAELRSHLVEMEKLFCLDLSDGNKLCSLMFSLKILKCLL